ncbi:MAG: hypothetical protein CFH03_01487 [Alphaproteobacteria bacterium MarineAlpha3_Bin2]|nr:MAG: hypothetical protein CFH03_01487 [Alphaproteobacteria bacterium MarineAlpha3_Bin2]
MSTNYRFFSNNCRHDAWRDLCRRKAHFEIKDFETDAGLFGRALVLRLPLSDDGETVNKGLNSYFFESMTEQSKLTDFYETIFSKIS